MPTNLEFLEPGFDPRALKVPELRRILTENNVQAPSKAKKNALIRLYNKEILPQLDDLRDRYKDVKPSSKGIKKIKRPEMIERSKEVKTTSSEKKKRTRDIVKKEEEQRSKQDVEKEGTKVEISNIPEDHKNKKNKKAKKAKEAKPKKEQTTTSEPPLEAKHANEVNNTQSENKTIKREVLKPNLSNLKVSPEFATLLKTASVQQEKQESKPISTPKQQPRRKEQEKSTFQEGVDVVSDSEEEQTKSADVNEKEIKDNGEHVKANKHAKFQWPKLRFRKSSKEASRPKESESKIKRSKSKLCTSKCIPFSKPNFQAIKHSSYNVFIFLLITVPILYMIWYRHQRIVVGYCDRELPLKSVVPSCLQHFFLETFDINLSTIDSWLSVLKPNCLPCPEGSICFPHMELTCHTHYRKILPLLSLNKLIPISEYCIPDVTKQKFVDGMVSSFVNLLRIQNAKLNCGDGENQEFNSISRGVLHNIFDQKVGSKWSSEEAVNLWESALEKLNELPEVKTFNVSSNKGDVVSVFVRSTSKEKIGIICKYGDVTRTRLSRHKYLILAATAFIIAAALLNCYIQRRAHYKENVEKNVTVTIEKLKAQTEHGKDGTFLHTLELRDVILADVIDLNERKKMWKSMATVMKKNKQITCALTEINGEIMECWSWKKEQVTEQ